MKLIENMKMIGAESFHFGCLNGLVPKGVDAETGDRPGAETGWCLNGLLPLD